MSTYAFDRLVPSAGAAYFDRLVDVNGVPVITGIGTVRDGSAIVITGTGFSASGNTVLLMQGTKTLQLGIGSEGTTSITSTALDASGLFITQPISIAVLNNSAVQSLATAAVILPKTTESATAISQDFLGDPSARASSSPNDVQKNDEIRIKNVVGGVISDVTVTAQGAFKVAAAVTAFDYGIMDGTVLGAFATVTWGDPITTGTVPNIAGLDFMTAQSFISTAGFVPVLIGQAQSASVPVGLVSAQFPAAGTTLTLGAVVEITTSLGATGVLVPILTGQRESDAQLARSQAGLIGQTYHLIDGVNSGLVLNQSIAPGTLVAVGAAVDIVVSSNLASNVVGLLLQDALNVLTNSNLTYDQTGFQFVYDSSAPLQSVMAQSPAADTGVAPGAQIMLTVSLGPSPVTTGVSPSVRRSARRFRM